MVFGKSGVLPTVEFGANRKNYSDLKSNTDFVVWLFWAGGYL